MTVAEWYKKMGESLISAEGRGQGYMSKIGNNAFMLSLSDDELNAVHPRPGESKRDYRKRLDMEAANSTFRGDVDVIVAVNWFLDRVAYSPQDREEILAKWKEQTGL
jgi:hypothetical protein